MGKKLFVGNISWQATDDQLKEHFAAIGEIEEAVIIKDKYSGRSKGFGFVTFANEENAASAQKKLDGQDFMERPLVVKEARPPKKNFHSRRDF